MGLLKESGRIVAIDQDALWVETIQQSTCTACSAKNGCGQTLLNRLGVRSVRIRVLMGDRPVSRYQPNAAIEIGIPEEVIVKVSVIVYLIPIVLSLGFSLIMHHIVNLEWLTILAAFIGFMVGLKLVWWHAQLNQNNTSYQPIIVDHEPSKVIQFL